MILYDFTCQSGHLFEAGVASMMSDNPNCPVCHTSSSRRPSRVNFGGQASTGYSRDQMPRSWQGTGGGDKETVKHWHKIAQKREKLEENHPELAGDRRPILAHEGIFTQKPLRAGDDIAQSVTAAISADRITKAKEAEK